MNFARTLVPVTLLVRLRVILFFHQRILLALSVVLMGTVIVVRAQGPGSSPEANGKKPPPYRIIVSDKLGISVLGEDELTLASRVDARGYVNLKLVGEINVYGLTLADAQKAIEAAYVLGRFLRSPDATVVIDEYAPRHVVIQGEVKNPSRYAMRPEAPMSIVELVSTAGGFTNSARGTKVKVTRKSLDGIRKVIEVDVEILLKKKESAENDDVGFFLEPNDLVFVPERLI